MLASRFREREYGMKTVWVAGIVLLGAAGAHAQSTIYKHVDESGRITYSNKPMKGASVLELDPIIMSLPLVAVPVAQRPAVVADKPQLEKASFTGDKPEARPIAATVTPLPRTTLASIEPQLQRRRDEERRRILEEELGQEESSLTRVRASLTQEQQNPELVAAVRMAQQATEPTPAQLAQMRDNLERASSRIRGLQATAAEHEKNVEALKKELGTLKP
jgi:hypothetical protein